MAVYKVPQDVEAEDKLLGPFSFRQFIYLIIAALGIFMAWLLSRIFVGLLVIPLPIIGFFLILALPLKKDQPMETYLIAVVRFFLKPRRRLWDPEGTFSMVQITAPKVAEIHLTKDFSGDEASERLSYLAQVVDTHGWAARGVTSPNDNMSDIVVAEAQQAEDMLDENAGVARNFDSMISKTDNTRKQAIVDQFQQALHTPAEPVTADPVTYTPPPTQASPGQQTPPAFNPYPDMKQHVLDPSGQNNFTPPQPALQPVAPPPVAAEPPKAQATPSDRPVSPDILRLANNNDLSISTIAHEAHRLKDKDEGEVVIELH